MRPQAPGTVWTWLLMQIDSRTITAFTRSDPGEDIAEGQEYFLTATVGAAATLRLAFLGLYEPTLEWTDIRVLVWGFFAALIFIGQRRLTKRQRERRLNDVQIVPTTFVGWSRTLKWREYVRAGNEEKRRLALMDGYDREFFAVGALSIALIYVGLIHFGIYLLITAVVLLAESRGLLFRSKQEFNALLNSMHHRARMERILQEIESRHGGGRDSGIVEVG